jgi:hypothetical protein
VVIIKGSDTEEVLVDVEVAIVVADPLVVEGVVGVEGPGTVPRNISYLRFRNGMVVGKT